jgi:hypothetical protein
MSSPDRPRLSSRRDLCHALIGTGAVAVATGVVIAAAPARTAELLEAAPVMYQRNILGC